MALQQKIPILQSPQIASYDYVDIAEGTGIQVFYGFVHKEQSTKKYSLTSQVIQSEEIYSVGSTSGGTAIKILDLDFDLQEFNLPKTIKGTATIQAVVASGSKATAGTTSDIYLIAKIRKWDGTTETEIANAQSSTSTLGNSGGTGYVDYYLNNFQISVPQTHFKKGETLRVTMELWGAKAGSNDANCYLCHSPTDILTLGTTPNPNKSLPTGNNGQVAPRTSTLKFYIPFKLNL